MDIGKQQRVIRVEPLEVGLASLERSEVPLTDEAAAAGADALVPAEDESVTAHVGEDVSIARQMMP